MSKSQSIKLADIVTDAGTQVRAELNLGTVDDYDSEMTRGSHFPPIDLFHDGSRYILADGFHRVMAAKRCKFQFIVATVHMGAKPDALKFALAANTVHGLKRSNADKRKSVEMALAEWPKLSNREIERICAVSDTLIAEVRAAQLPDSGSSKRVGADGKERSMPKKKPTVEQFAETVAPRLTAGATPLAAAGPVTRDNSSAYTSAPVAVKARKLNEFEQKAITELEVCIENSKFVIDQIRAGEYSPDEANDCRLQFQVAAKILKALPKQEAEKS